MIDPELPPISPDRLTITGVSAGAYMAQQLHLAWSQRIDGVALVATGPWGCADGALGTAMSRCLASAKADLDVAALARRAAALAQAEAIDPLSGLAGDRVWIFSGTLDRTIDPSLGPVTAHFYQHWLAEDQVRTVTDVAAAHLFPTLDQGVACDVSASPWLGACQYDTAGKALAFLLGDLAPPVDAPDGRWVSLDIEEDRQSGLFETAWLYLPKACDSGPPCRLHLVLHGCAQSAETLGTAFVEGSGYARWADTNRLAVVFPQVTASAANPYACWDWWGYSGEAFETRSGSQPAAIMALVDRITRGVSQK